MQLRLRECPHTMVISSGQRNTLIKYINSGGDLYEYNKIPVPKISLIVRPH